MTCRSKRQGAPLGSDCCFIIFACKTWKNHHQLHNYPNSFAYYYHNHYQNNIHYHQHIFNVKTGLPMCYHIFLKGFLSSVYHSNNNCHNYHYFHYYHPTCPNIHQNINYYVQINIHVKIAVPFKVSKQKIIAIYCPFSPQFCRMKFVKKIQWSQNMQILRQLIIFPYT